MPATIVNVQAAKNEERNKDFFNTRIIRKGKKSTSDRFVSMYNVHKTMRPIAS